MRSKKSWMWPPAKPKFWIGLRIRSRWAFGPRSGPSARAHTSWTQRQLAFSGVGNRYLFHKCILIKTTNFFINNWSKAILFWKGERYVPCLTVMIQSIVYIGPVELYKQTNKQKKNKNWEPRDTSVVLWHQQVV